MPRRIAGAREGGGVGKPPVTLTRALPWAEHARRTLLVDLDPQGGVGHSLAKGDGELIGLADVLAGQASVEQAVLPTHEPSLSLLPRGRLDPVDVCELVLLLQAPGGVAAATIVSLVPPRG